MPSAPRSRRLLVGELDDEVRHALDWAEVAAMLGDFAEALTWLDKAATLTGGLPDEFAARRSEWTARIS